MAPPLSESDKIHVRHIARRWHAGCDDEKQAVFDIAFLIGLIGKLTNEEIFTPEDGEAKDKP